MKPYKITFPELLNAADKAGDRLSKMSEQELSELSAAARKLGRMAKGKPKRYTKAELERRRKQMQAINEAKRKAKQ